MPEEGAADIHSYCAEKFAELDFLKVAVMGNGLQAVIEKQEAAIDRLTTVVSRFETWLPVMEDATTIIRSVSITYRVGRWLLLRLSMIGVPLVAILGTLRALGIL